MNKKGMTLVEVIATIMVLSIAGVMIFAGINTVIKFMGDASKLKNASDILLSYAQKSDNSELRGNVVDQPSITSYTISTTQGNSFTMDIHKNSLMVKNYDKIALTPLVGMELTKVEDTLEYISLDTYVDKIVELVSLKLSDGYYDNAPYNMIVNQLYITSFLNAWDVIPRGMLPEELKKKSSLADPYKIRFAFPWDIDANPPEAVIHGGLLIHLSKSSEVLEHQEEVRMIYDYDDKTWYFSPEENIPQAEIIKYGYQFELLPSDVSFVLTKDGQESNSIRSWVQLKEHIHHPNSHWQYLDKSNEYNPENSSMMWKNINQK